MADRDLINNLKKGRVASAGATPPTANLAPAARSATTLSAALDLQGYHGAIVIAQIGTYGDAASGTVFIEAELQDSPDNVTYTAVPDSLTQYPPGDAPRVGSVATGGVFFNSKTTGTGAVDLAGTYSVGYLGQNRYLKVNLRFTSATNPTPCSAVLVAGLPDYAPVVGNQT